MEHICSSNRRPLPCLWIRWALAGEYSEACRKRQAASCGVRQILYWYHIWSSVCYMASWLEKLKLACKILCIDKLLRITFLHFYHGSVTQRKKYCEVKIQVYFLLSSFLHRKDREWGDCLSSSTSLSHGQTRTPTSLEERHIGIWAMGNESRKSQRRK